ncbi:hypothetical protein SAMN04488595_1392 [Ralstonia sp. 25mfcol4.1]|uniref:DUF6984 family protein n=1 Tax=Ralstonia sp. 25mfcol4.1 TaxID=1761899 RepID=UPI00087FBCB2|nr:hypothetical protein [Ralstonia sp. 25mfcol4.1]SDP83267.1 hypothetical protein SAMN04488595_1392 [Ralstonia sp. 25mfcol4.1]
MIQILAEERKKLLRRMGELGNFPSIKLVLDENLIVEDLNDGGMGSFKIILPLEYQGKNTGQSAIDVVSEDVDGVMLIASLFLNERGFPCEVDIWKVDFSTLVRLPTTWELANFPRFPGSGTGENSC